SNVAGEVTSAPCGHTTLTPSIPPSANVNATSRGSFIVLRGTRKAVAPASGLTRNSTKSAALFAYIGFVAYVNVPAVGANRNALGPIGAFGSGAPAPPWSSYRKS